MDSGGSTILSFMEFTSTDEDQARYFIESAHGNLEVALNMYFSEADSYPASEALRTEDATPTSRNVESQASTFANIPCATSQKNLTLLTWNIDGLSESNLHPRARAVCKIINSRLPDVVYLQEVVPETFNLLADSCKGYDSFPHQYKGSYFNMILVKRSSISYNTLDYDCEYFPGSNMGRHLLTLEAKFNGHLLVLMATHLESTAQCVSERKGQLQFVLDKITQQENSKTVLFGGDLNLRDKELQQIGGLPPGVIDAWEARGRDPSMEYTWDTSVNDNLSVPFKCKLRFDRLFVRPAGSLYPLSFSLVGKDRLPCGQFPSDHWGIWCEFS